ncbi:MAG: hypothetical protein VX468_01595, partial [Pseudomonadota bacterium]|nr:hypothetical protein [Pseudomonadota bacterium]
HQLFLYQQTPFLYLPFVRLPFKNLIAFELVYDRDQLITFHNRHIFYTAINMSAQQKQLIF